MSTWPPPPQRAVYAQPKKETSVLAVWSLRLSIGGALLFGLLFGLLLGLGYAPPSNPYVMWLTRWDERLFLICPMLWLPSLAFGVIARKHPMARLSLIIAIAAILVFIALLFPMLQPVWERA